MVSEDLTPTALIEWLNGLDLSEWIPFSEDRRDALVSALTDLARPQSAAVELPETVYKAVERVLDECSAWIARPNAEITKRVALAAGIAWSLHAPHYPEAAAVDFSRYEGLLTGWHIRHEDEIWTEDGGFVAALGDASTPESRLALDAPKLLSALRQSQAENERYKAALSDLLAYTEGQTCTHEDTYRGGIIWTICNGCGAKWADDMGGFQPYVADPAIINARAALTPPTGEAK